MLLPENGASVVVRAPHRTRQLQSNGLGAAHNVLFGGSLQTRFPAASGNGTGLALPNGG
jgi:hypothetical protein